LRKVFVAFDLEFDTSISKPACESSTERKGEKRKWGGSKRHYIGGGGQETISPILKVPRQCPLVLLVEELHMIGISFLCNVGRAAITVKFDLTL
jgi:hypothetical protein